jgi:acyl carrier protein|tara:strand:+ start:869 stop:1096 length:228 start_codon:yes stop_codon:yes gene_type:complete
MDKLNIIISKVFDINPEEIDERKGPNEIDKWDSIQHLNLVNAIEDEFDLVFDLKEILEIMSIGDIYSILKRKGVI